jgi:hypothetical protein
MMLVMMLAACAGPRAIGPAQSPLPFIDDDYHRALSEARASKKPIFVETWAPW